MEPAKGKINSESSGVYRLQKICSHTLVASIALCYDFVHVSGLEKDRSVLDKYSSNAVRHLLLFLSNNSCRIVQSVHSLGVIHIQNLRIFKTYSLRRHPLVDVPRISAPSVVAYSKHPRSSTPASSSPPSNSAASDIFPGYTQNTPLSRDANPRPVSYYVGGGRSESCDFVDGVFWRPRRNDCFDGTRKEDSPGR
jgi:hypothetical protein